MTDAPGTRLAPAGSARIALVTFPDAETAARIARTLVEEQLVACANLVPGVRSIYAWEGEVQDDAEVLGLLKTTAETAERFTARVVALHPFDTPEVVLLAPEAVEERYLAWLSGAVDTGRGEATR